MDRSNKKNKIIHFEPSGIEVEVTPDQSLLEAAWQAGLTLRSACSGAGTCGSCRIKLIRGRLATRPAPGLSSSEYKQGFRLACQSFAQGDVAVEIPVDHSDFLTATATPGCSIISGSSLTIPSDDRQPLASNLLVRLTPPASRDNQCDLARLKRQLSILNYNNISPGYQVIRTLPQTLRNGEWMVTATIVADDNNYHLIRLQSGDKSDKSYCLVLDIGTTAIRGRLLDIESAQVQAESTAYNRQAIYGQDVLSRISYCRHQDGLHRLQKAVTGTINLMIDSLLKAALVDREDIIHVVAAANTVMIHLLLGINPDPLRISPYVPAIDSPPLIEAYRLGINLPDHVYIYCLPSVASYVGGDVVAGIMGCGLHQREEVCLYIDIGTNGEIVAGNRDWLMAAACSAGPTFEGGGISCGMLAIPGAIENISFEYGSGQVTAQVIGGILPGGICGSGIINTVHALFEAGIIDRNGKFNLDCGSQHLRSGPGGPYFILLEGTDTIDGKDIILTQADIDNFIRSKAAIYAGCQTLLESAGLSFTDIETVFISGTFGSHIDLENAIGIGMLPDLPRQKFYFIGNSALYGASLICMSQQLCKDAGRVSGMMTVIELSESVTFMDNYIASLFLPHTDSGQFPSSKHGK